MTDNTNVYGDVVRATRDLSARLATLDGLPPAPAVAFADPTHYLREYYDAYLRRAASGPRRVLIVGMNPSPHGMAQTGVPFGDVDTARRLLAGVDLPAPSVREVRARSGELLLKVEGLGYHRREESGSRLWSAVEQVCGGLDRALEVACLINYCPLVFLSETGANIPPADWPTRSDTMRGMLGACHDHLRTLVRLLRPAHVVALGKWAHDRCDEVMQACSIGVGFKPQRLWQMRHPNPRAGSAEAFFSAAAPVLVQTCGVQS